MSGLNAQDVEPRGTGGLKRVRIVVCYGLTLAVALFGLNVLWVLFFGGINSRVGGIEIRSTTLGFPATALLATLVLLFIVKGKGKEAALFCGSLLVSCLVGEVIVRLVDHPLSKPYVDDVSWFEPSDSFGHQLVPALEGFGPLSIPIKTNSRGFRDGEHSWDKQEGTIRILGLGDSFMFGLGVAAERTFLKQLGSSLRQATGNNVETINAGVPGWGLNQYYLYLKKVGVKYSPDVIVLAYFTDDLPDSLLEAIPPNNQHRAGMKFKGGVLHHSRFYNFAKSLTDGVRQKNRTTRLAYLHNLDSRRREWGKRTQYLMAVGRDGDSDGHVALLNEYLIRINTVAKQHHATLLVLFIPDVSQLHHPELQHINRLLERLTRTQAIPFLDMTSIFEQAADVGAYYLWPRDPHTNARGHAEIARALAEPICEALSAENSVCLGHSGHGRGPVSP